MKSSLEHKTIRPGSLSEYSFYYSKRQPVKEISRPSASATRLPFIKLLVVVLILVSGFAAYRHSSLSSSTPTPEPTASEATKSAPAAVAKQPTNQCAGNNFDKMIKISISQRHLWACEGEKVAFPSAVITGYQKLPETETPLGTYKIYAKQMDTVLTGSDGLGSWRMPVDYWMPFLDNEHGTYGFHDATWRKPSEFGNIDPFTSKKASHGCIELPLGQSKQLYEWSPPGTVLTVVS